MTNDVTGTVTTRQESLLVEIIVYIKPESVECKAVQRFLDQSGIDYELRDITTNVHAAEEIVRLGHEQLPIVVSPYGKWSGYQPSCLTALIEVIRSKERFDEAVQRLATLC